MRRTFTCLWLIMIAHCACLVGESNRARPGRVIKVKTTHYEIECDLGPSFTRELMRHMEAIYCEYYRRLKGYGGWTSGRFRVKVFRRKADYLNAVGKAMVNTAGLYVPAKRLLAAVAEGQTYERVMRTLYHEGFHQFTDIFLGGIHRIPPWAAEGLALLFEEATWNGRKFEIGQVPTVRVETLRRALETKTWIPLARLVNMNYQEWNANVRNSPVTAANEYAEAWSVIHFLVYAERGRYRKTLVRYLKLLNEGKRSDEAFRAAFGKRLRVFESKWKSYVKTLEPSEKFICKEQLMILASFLPAVSRNKNALDSIDAFKTGLLSNFAGRQLLAPVMGKRQLSAEELKRLFVCPLARKGKRVAPYRLKEILPFAVDKPTEKVRAIVCLNHPGIILMGFCQRDHKTGKVIARPDEKVKTSRTR